MSRKPLTKLPCEVFLSHSSRDRKFASQIAALLRDHGVPVWYSETNLLGAQQWHDEIGEALTRCDWFLVLLSPQATQSKWVKRELLYALRSSHFEERILPLNYRKCDASKLSWTLDDFQSVDFTGDYENGCRSLLRTWGIGFHSLVKARPAPKKTKR